MKPPVSMCNRYTTNMGTKKSLTKLKINCAIYN